MELPLWCIYLHGKPWPKILVPFMGTGTTLVLTRHALASRVGIDVDPAYLGTASNRVQATSEAAIDVTLNADEVFILTRQYTGTDTNVCRFCTLLGPELDGTAPTGLEATQSETSA